MTVDSLLGVALAGLFITGLSAIAVKVLREFSRYELDEYCKKRSQTSRFDAILRDHEQIAHAVESLQMCGTVLLILAGSLWMFGAGGSVVLPSWVSLLAGAGVGILILVAVSNWIPWAVVSLWAEPVLYHCWGVLRFLGLIMWPLTVGIDLVSAFFRRLAGREEEEDDDEEAFEEEIRSIVTAGLRDGLVDADAREMIEGVMELGDGDVSDIMTPRSEVDAIDCEMSWPEVIRFTIESGRTRVPVYKDTFDNIVGILYAKDLLPELSKGTGLPGRPLKEMLREVWRVPNTKRLDDMLRDFLKTRNHLALVMDEYNSVAGVVTIEDVLEEIVGEIVDEWDDEEIEEIRRVDDHTADVLGRTHLDDVREQLGLDLPETDEFDTIGGHVIAHFGRIPKAGERLHIGDTKVTVLESSRRSVTRLRMELPAANSRPLQT